MKSRSLFSSSQVQSAVGFPPSAAALLSAALCAISVHAGPVASSQPAANRQIVHGHIPAAVAQLAPVSRVEASRRLNIAIGLPLRNREALNALFQQLYDPSSPRYRHYLTPEQFADSFGPSRQDYQAVRDFAEAHGLTVNAAYPSRLVLSVSGSAAQLEQALHVTLRTYQHPSENRQFFAPDVEPSLDLSVPILHISGLDNFSIPHPASFHAKPLDRNAPVRPNLGTGPSGAFGGTDFRNAYLPGVALDGSGQTVGLLEFDGYYQADIATYVQNTGIPGVQLQNVFINGFSGTPGAANGEVALDIEVVMAMAPNLSSIIVYQAPNPTPFSDMFSRMASDTQVKQFSSSWAGGSPDAAADQVLLQMAVQGQSVFNASGDNCAYTGDIPYPSDSPYLTSVGGTTLTTATNGAYGSEKVWNSGGGVGSSGGISTFYPIPSYQQTVNLATSSGSTSLRNIPDVALTADNIYIVADNGSDENVGGTSAAAPLWAAVTALANQLATTGCGAPVGFLNPIIYGIGKSSSYTNSMHDIIKGDNTGPSSPTRFSAVIGYDLCTGFGTPKPNILSALAGPAAGAPSLSIQPLPASALISNDIQPVSVTISGVTNATVSATIAGTATVLSFTNSGFVYTALLHVPVAPATVTLNLVAQVPGRPAITNTFSYSSIPAPGNDKFANATKVPAAGAVYLANNRNATTETGEPFQDGDAARAGSLWWSWTPTFNTSVLIDTAGSKVDNVVAVYTGDILSSLVPLGSDSSTIAQLHPGHVVFNAVAGQAYRISIASKSTNTLGSLKFSVLPATQPDTTAPVVTVAGPQSGLTVTNQLVVVTGTASDSGGPYSTGVSKVVLSVNGCVSSPASGTTSWSAPLILQPELNVIQAIAYDDAGNASAPVTIELVYFAISPGNDFFAAATPLTSTVGTNSVDTSNATKETGEPAHAGNTGGKSVWYSFVAPQDGVLTLSTEGSTFDTLLAVYTGDVVSDLTLVASDDDAFLGAPGGFSLLNVPVHANFLYHIAVDGYGGASGSALLTYSFAPAKLVHLDATTTGAGTIQLASINSLGGKNIEPGSSIDVASGTTVVLTPTPASGYHFDSWSGTVNSFSAPLTLVLNADSSITAHFVPIVFSDDFESGTLRHLGWTTSGNAPWVVEGTNVAAGKFAAGSGVIGNNQSSSLILTTNFASSTGSFDYRVSSEVNFDFLRFFIDGNLVQQWSGEAGWATFSFPVPSGAHTLEWRYVKDPSGTSGLDAAFIDNVNLPIVLPTDSTTPATLSWFRGTDGSLTINLTGQVNQQYILQTSTDLIHWQDVSTGAAANGLLRINPGPLANPYQFYRAVVP